MIARKRLVLALVMVGLGIAWGLVDTVKVKAQGMRTSAPQIVLTTTVGVTPFTCAQSDSVTTKAGSVVHYCYTVQNSGDAVLSHHVISDTVWGQVAQFDFPLLPKEVVSLVVSRTVWAETVSVATWQAGDGVVVVASTDGVAVSVEQPTAVGLSGWGGVGAGGQGAFWWVIVLVGVGYLFLRCMVRKNVQRTKRIIRRL